MMKKIAILLAICTCFITSNLIHIGFDPSEQKVYITVMKEVDTDSKEISIKIVNQSNQEYRFSDNLILEKEQDGKWNRIAKIYNMLEIAYLFKPYSSIELTFPLTPDDTYYIENEKGRQSQIFLSVGNYRLSLELYDDLGQKHNIYSEFQVTH